MGHAKLESSTNLIRYPLIKVKKKKTVKSFIKKPNRLCFSCQNCRHLSILVSACISPTAFKGFFFSLYDFGGRFTPKRRRYEECGRIPTGRLGRKLKLRGPFNKPKDSISKNLIRSPGRSIHFRTNQKL